MTTWDDVTAATVPQLVRWAAGRPWAAAMAACGQDSGWHAEGDVWTHTKMVIRELENLTEWPELAPGARLALVFTAFFHDAGKPATTETDPATGRVRAPKHALVGAGIARAVLRELGAGLAFRERVANLVRYHGRPPHVLEKPDPARVVVGTSWLCPNDLLYLFALADGRGRTTADTDRSEDDLHLWKVAAEEAGCFDRPYPFANDHARVLFYRDRLPDLGYGPREDFRCRVTLMAGLPGAGKDTWLARHRSCLPVVALDDIRADLGVAPTDDQGSVVQAARERCREHLRAGRDFAFNATNTVRQTRAKWIDLFTDYQARVEIVYVEPPLSTVHGRNAGRPAPVPRRVIDKLADRLEPPTWAEAHGLEFVG
ncbi:MAG: AAA family ATPase [Fimbriiglobus sp.]